MADDVLALILKRWMSLIKMSILEGHSELPTRNDISFACVQRHPISERTLQSNGCLCQAITKGITRLMMFK